MQRNKCFGCENIGDFILFCDSCQSEKILVSRGGLERLQKYIILGEYPKAIGMLSTILVQGVDTDTAS